MISQSGLRPWERERQFRAILLAKRPQERLRWQATLPRARQIELHYSWGIWARDEQLPPPGIWRTWLLLAGRGFGKTRTLCEWVRAEVNAGRARRIAIVGRTAGDVRDVLIEGEAGILAVHPPKARPRYYPSKRRLEWPNGAVATTFSADEPDALRGPSHDLAICDELAAWRYEAAWHNLQMGLRLGENPRCAIATTPRPIKLLRDLIANPNTHATRGSTYANRANLAPAFLEQIIRRYEGTRLGRQELLAEILDDNPGALWTRGIIDAGRVSEVPQLARVAVGVDPQAADDEEGAETGIVVAGATAAEHGYVLDDRTLRARPERWARQVVAAYHACRGDVVVAEANNGGEMVRHTVHTIDPTVPVTLVYASRAKRTRAEPVSALYEQGRVHHVGMFAALEDQMCEWAPYEGLPSPDRMDALVWALTVLLVEPRSRARVTVPLRRRARG